MTCRNIVAALVSVFLLSSSCKKAKNQSPQDHPVPYVPLSISVYPNDPVHFAVQSIGGWEYLQGGVNGIVLYRKSDQEFVALERTSSYYPDRQEAKVLMMKDNFTLRDTLSGSEWRVFDGAVTKGPAEWPLRAYGCSFDGNLLRIVN